MNSKILLSLVTIAAVGAIAVGGTIAYFSDSVPITGITMSSGNADLKISNQENGSYVDEFNATAYASTTLQNLYPGEDLLGTDGLNFYLKNASASNIGLDTYFKVETTSGDYSLCNAIQLKLVRMGGYETGYHSLCWWRDTFGATGWRMMDEEGVPEVIYQGNVHGWTAFAKVDPNAGNEIAGKSLGVKITFDAQQHH